jgi:peptide chain release factor 1
MIDRLELMARRHDELSALMAQPEVATDPDLVSQYAREAASLADVVRSYREYLSVSQSLAETEAMLSDGLDAEMAELAREEVETLRQRQDALLAALKGELAPRDPNDEKDVVVEIRAGTGGDEAALFAADLYRMYSRYAERHRWGVDVVDLHEIGIGGFKEIVFEIHGRGAYSDLKFESGVHRVQRVPATEAQGRIHTSTATVAVLPEVADVEVDIKEEDLRIDVFRSSGAGGQNVQKNSTAIRITHIPSGMVVTCQDERSQLKNRTKAMNVLRARLFAIEQRKRDEAIESSRRSQVGSGERSEKIRTYNFPQDRLTDHRIGLTVHGLERVLDGDLGAVIEALQTHDREEREAGAPA